MKTEIKEWLATFPSNKKKVKALLSGIHQLDDSQTSHDHLRRLLLCNFAISLQINPPILPTRECERIVEMALSILRLHRIDPKSSRLRILFGDVHLGLSQIYQARGFHWEALWEQQKFLNVYPNVSFAHFSYALRALRVGNGTTALRSFVYAIETGLGSPHLERARIELIKLARFSGDLAQINQLYKKAASDLKGKESFQKELDWQLHCCEPWDNASLGALERMVRKKGRFHESDYIIEAFLIFKSSPDARWRNRFPTMQKLAHDSHIRFDKTSAFYRIARVIEVIGAADYQPNLDTLRMDRVFDEINRLRTADEVLLIWAAMSRLLGQNKQTSEFAAIAQEEYVSLSLRLSSGRNKDALGFFSSFAAATAA